jgi:hypothetical protein
MLAPATQTILQVAGPKRRSRNGSRPFDLRAGVSRQSSPASRHRMRAIGEYEVRDRRANETCSSGRARLLQFAGRSGRAWRYGCLCSSSKAAARSATTLAAVRSGEAGALLSEHCEPRGDASRKRVAGRMPGPMGRPGQSRPRGRPRSGCDAHVVVGRSVRRARTDCGQDYGARAMTTLPLARPPSMWAMACGASSNGYVRPTMWCRTPVSISVVIWPRRVPPGVH